jgi:hypothetical protein
VGILFKNKPMKQNPVLHSLCQRANNVLSKDIPKMRSAVPIAALSLKPFVVGGLGNFPYYYKDPNTQTFNRKTYDWIKTNLEAQTNPHAQAVGSTLPNLFIDVFSKITYSLSTKHLDELAAAGEEIFTYQKKLLAAWVQAYGPIKPEEGKTIIDKVITIIITSWTSTPITFDDLLDTSNSMGILTNIPASGYPIMPSLINYINAVNKSNSLVISSPLNTGYLNKALAAAQYPDQSNGGMTLNDNSIQPAYVINTSLKDIIDGLKNTSKIITVTASVSHVNDNEIKVDISGNVPFNIHPHNFFKITVNSDPKYFSKLLKQASEPIKIDLSFRGVTMVNFQPVAFSKANNKNWFWSEPILEAIQNGGKDVTGYKFSPTPNIDFTKDGPFGFLTGVAISNFPVINIKLSSTGHKDIETSINDSDSIEIELLGNAIETDSPGPNITKSVKADASTNSVTISLGHSSSLIPSLESRAWVHGVQVTYPLAMASKDISCV